MTIEARCPYCQNPLEKQPKRKKKCPHCGEYMYVRGGKAYTEKQVKEYDFLRPWLGRLESKYGVSEKEFEKYRQDLSKEFGFRASSSDTVWRVLNSQISEIRLYPTEKHRSLYLEMAYFVRAEGQNPRSYLESANKVQSDLIKKKIQQERTAYSSSPDLKWDLLSCNDELVCTSCREFEQKALSEREAISVPLLCTGEMGCRCELLIVLESIDFDGLGAQPDTNDPFEKDSPWWKFWG